MYNLERFIKAQEKEYSNALREIRNGYKSGHWMWFIFPQLSGLGFSSMSNYYGISSIDEAREYLKNEILSRRLIEISTLLLNIDGKDIDEILGYPDNLKLQSCMTLFNEADNSIIVFKEILDKYYDGKKDAKTLELLDIRSQYML